MPIRIVRLGSPRHEPGELRAGTVRHPPRGVPKSEYASRDLYDVWFPSLAPSAELLREGKDATDPRDWRAFERRFRAEMNEPHARHALDLLAALSHKTSLSIGCYCADEARCHRSILRSLLVARGAAVV